MTWWVMACVREGSRPRLAKVRMAGRELSAVQGKAMMSCFCEVGLAVRNPAKNQNGYWKKGTRQQP